MSEDKELWTLNDGIDFCKKHKISVTRPTAASWVSQYNLGYQLGGNHGRYVIYSKKWKKFVLTGEWENKDNMKDDKND